MNFQKLVLKKIDLREELHWQNSQEMWAAQNTEKIPGWLRKNKKKEAPEGVSLGATYLRILIILKCGEMLGLILSGEENAKEN